MLNAWTQLGSPAPAGFAPGMPPGGGRTRARPEPDRFTLEIPYSNARAIAASRAAFRVIEEEDKGDCLRLRIAGERRNLGSLVRFVEQDEAASETLHLRRRAR